MRSATLIGAALAALSMTAPAPARAQEAAAATEDAEGQIVGILHLEFSGISETAAAAFEDSIEGMLIDGGYRVAPRKRMEEMLGPSSYAAGCRFGPCLREVHRNTEVRLVLVGQISAVGPAYTLVLTLLDTRLGRPTSQVVETCEVCTIEEAITSATLAVVGLTVGTAGAMVDPNLGPTSTGKLPDFKKELAARDALLTSRRRRLGQAALFFAGAAALAGGAGAYFAATDRRNSGLPLVGAAGGFAVASGTLLVLSRKF